MAAGIRSKPSGCALALITVTVVIALFIASVGPYTDYVWFNEDVGYTRIFTLEYSVRAMLFACGLFPTWLVLSLALRRLASVRIVFSEIPDQSLRFISEAISFAQQHGAKVVRFGSLIVGIVVGSGLADGWQSYLVARNGHEFGRKDPIFGLDYSVYVFKLPWWNSVLGSVLGLAVLIAGLYVAMTYALTAVQRLTHTEGARNQLVGTAAGWLGVVGLLAAAKMAMSCLDFGMQPGSQFVGAGYSEIVRLHATEFLIICVVLAALVTLIRRNLAIALRAYAVCLLPLVVGVGIVPGVIQAIHVEPDKNSVEAPFAARSIAATRYGYDIESVESKVMETNPEPSTAEVQSAQTTFENMRLWDPMVFREAMDQLQTFKQYYSFRDVDVDRYKIADSTGNVRQQTVMVAPRDISLPGLGSTAQTWVNTRLVYTHGYGLVVAPVTTENSLGQPAPVVRDIPLVAPPELKVDQPQIYFSDYRFDTGESYDPYAIVHTRVNEFDHPTQQGDALSNWTGQRGIRIASFFNRLAFSASLGDMKLLVTDNLTSGSRLIIHRGLLDRAALVYPFLTLDTDPYMVVLGGKLVWLLDAYTTSDQLPYSAYTSFGGKDVNYVRNSVKIAIDAYSGEMTAYALRANDPILETWRSIYPDLVHDVSEAPAELRAHFRYPQQLFEAQSSVLCAYHVTDPQTFLKNEDAWSIPNERGLNGDKAVEEPYYLQMRLPDAASDEFLLMRGFTPFKRDNLSGWLAAHCDGDSYGKLTLYMFSRGATVPGPAQVETLFVQDPGIANVNRQFNNDQSEIVVGNLLVVPVGQSVVYAESLFLRGRTGIRGIPELRKVILAVGDRIAMGDTYAEAYQKLFGVGMRGVSKPTTPAGAVSPTAAVKPTPAASNSAQQAISTAVHELDQADEALRKGDFATYGELQKRARATLKSAAGSP
jgi:hypothetical protein